MNSIVLYIDTALIAFFGALKGLKAYATAKAIAAMRKRVRAATKDMTDGAGVGIPDGSVGSGIDAGSGSSGSSSSGSSN